MLRTYQYKIYPNQTQIATLERWLRTCCWIYNQALEHRIKAYKRRGESVKYNDQQAMLTGWRKRIDSLRSVPCEFERDALRRVDRGFKAFFRRVKAGEKSGFPRFRSWRRYNSIEYLDAGKHLRGSSMYIPSIGLVRCRGRSLPPGTQKALRIIRRATGWYAQVVLDDSKQPATTSTEPPASPIGIDLGLSSFATLSDGTAIANPRFSYESARRIRALQRRVSRRVKGSGRRARAVLALRRQYELIADQRRNFSHQHTTALVRSYDLIAVEKLNIQGMSRSRFGKSILDAAWGIFLGQLRVKAECAGRRVVEVDPRGTSQECPICGNVKPKKLSEREHRCDCGSVMDRDHAAAQVILARALVATGEVTSVEESASYPALVAPDKADPMKRENKSRITL